MAEVPFSSLVSGPVYVQVLFCSAVTELLTTAFLFFGIRHIRPLKESLDYLIAKCAHCATTSMLLCRHIS